jgi:hypothetical protein
MPKRIDLTGKRFGDLTVLRLNGKIGSGIACDVLCDCGTTKTILQCKLTKKHKPTRSCGCGVLKNHPKTHELSNHELYPLWRSMMARCYNEKNKSYCNYGGRGIKVCSSWKETPKNLIKWLELKNYKKGLEIDRIDNNGDYSPDNCRLVTSQINSRNRRNNFFVKYKGKYITIPELSEISGVKYGTLYQRLKIKGMSLQEALPQSIGKEGLQ